MLPGAALARRYGTDWSAHEENTARLYEVLAYTLELAWADRTVDPEDREVRKKRREDEARGVKPPPHPIVPPVALRPLALADQRREAYLAEVALYSAPQREREQITTDEFDRLIELG